jgi:hypothetical protein
MDDKKRMTTFFGSCNKSPCRHCHRARTGVAPTPKQINQHTCRQGEAVDQPWVPQFQAIGINQIAASWAPPYPVAAFCYVKVFLFGSAQDERVLGVKDGPHSRWTMMTNTTPPRRRLPKPSSEDDVLLRAWRSPARDQGLP